jgi:hypothetical protein
MDGSSTHDHGASGRRPVACAHASCTHYSRSAAHLDKAVVVVALARRRCARSGLCTCAARCRCLRATALAKGPGCLLSRCPLLVLLHLVLNGDAVKGGVVSVERDQLLALHAYVNGRMRWGWWELHSCLLQPAQQTHSTHARTQAHTHTHTHTHTHLQVVDANGKVHQWRLLVLLLCCIVVSRRQQGAVHVPAQLQHQAICAGH